MISMEWNLLDWTLVVREERLTEPLRWRKPRMVFVNSMSDLFHEDVPLDFIDQVFAVMALCPRHTFQILTKRPERMAEYLASSEQALSTENRIWFAANGKQLSGDGRILNVPQQWPLPNVWLGASVEDQATADARIPHLLRCPAAVRFVSAEPLLGAVDFSDCLGDTLVGAWDTETGKQISDGPGPYSVIKGIDWVIVGGESGAKARPCNVAWIRSIIRQCREAGVPVFVKQLGARPIVTEYEAWQLSGMDPGWDDRCRRRDVLVGLRLTDPKGGNLAEWPMDLRVREMPIVGGGK